MNTRAANRYAKALLELATENSQEQAVHKDMQLVGETIAESSELDMLLHSPIFKISDKKAAINAVFGGKVTALSNNLFDLLETNKRMPLLGLIAKQYGVLYNQAKKVVQATVTTAFPIGNTLQSKILAKAQELAKGKQINLKSTIDPNIIGGFILRVGDVQIDASILNKLGNLKRELKE
jgi:F-type H+-transporting ATPase subunit delta